MCVSQVPSPSRFLRRREWAKIRGKMSAEYCRKWWTVLNSKHRNQRNESNVRWPADHVVAQRLLSGLRSEKSTTCNSQITWIITLWLRLIQNSSLRDQSWLLTWFCALLTTITHTVSKPMQTRCSDGRPCKRCVSADLVSCYHAVTQATTLAIACLSIHVVSCHHATDVRLKIMAASSAFDFCTNYVSETLIVSAWETKYASMWSLNLSHLKCQIDMLANMQVRKRIANCVDRNSDHDLVDRNKQYAATSSFILLLRTAHVLNISTHTCAGITGQENPYSTQCFGP